MSREVSIEVVDANKAREAAWKNLEEFGSRIIDVLTEDGNRFDSARWSLGECGVRVTSTRTVFRSKTEKAAMKRHEDCMSPRCECESVCNVQEAVNAEREACAKLADEFCELPHGSVPFQGLEATAAAARQIARAIRSRQ